MSDKNGKRVVYGYNTEEGFDRAARAMRYVERLRHGLTDPQPQDPRPSQSTTALVRTRYTGGLSVPSNDPDQLYPIEVMGYDDETGGWRVLTDPSGDPILGLASGMNNEALQNPPDPSSPGTVYPAHIVGYYHWVDDPDLCDPSYEKFQGGPLYRVAVGGGGVAVTGEQYVRVTGDDGGSPPLYSGVVVHQTAPNTWADTATVYTDKIIRPPSNLAPPLIPPDQVVVVEPDPDNPTYYRIKGAVGGVQEVVIGIPWSWQINVGDPCTITIATVKDLTIRARDLTATLGSEHAP